MPPISQLLLRASLAWLAIGTLIGTLILTTKAGILPGQFLALRSAHGQIMLLGWMLQAALGTALWIFPRISGQGIPNNKRIALAGAWALNLGILLTLLAQILTISQIGWSGLAFIAALLELVSGPLLISQVWKRTRAIPPCNPST